MTYEIEEISNTDMFEHVIEHIYKHRDGGSYYRSGNLFKRYYLDGTRFMPDNKAYKLLTKEEKVLKILKDYERSRL